MNELEKLIQLCHGLYNERYSVHPETWDSPTPMRFSIFLHSGDEVSILWGQLALYAKEPFFEIAFFERDQKGLSDRYRDEWGDQVTRLGTAEEAKAWIDRFMADLAKERAYANISDTAL